MATLAELKTVLAEHFDRAVIRTISLRLMSAGDIPIGSKGRGGSAQIEPRHAATVLLAIAAGAWSQPIERSAEVRRLARFTLQYPRTDDPPELALVLAGEIRRAADPGYRPGSWRVGEYSVTRGAGREMWVFEGEQLPSMTLLLNRNTEIASALISAIGKLFASVPAVVEAAD
jgi:hypothetical protein